jgi:ATP-dependent DNA helicase RecQ
MDTKNIFEKYFKSLSDEFSLSDMQKKAIESVVDGKNTLCLMPTGSGKSLIYWIAGKALNGTTLVISPLNALIDEQALKLKEHGINVLVLHGGTDPKKQYEELIGLYNLTKIPDFIFASPERIATDGYLEFVLKERKDQVKLVTIDEIHCVSQWGFDFRPFYKQIPFFLNNVFGSNWCTILGLTATINPNDRKQICKDFNIPESNVLQSKILLRHKIELDVVKVRDEDEKDSLFWEEIQNHSGEKILIYQYRKEGKRSTEELCKTAQDKGYKAAFFHGDMDSDSKLDVLKKFKKGDIQLVFATNAFGMGIDIKDIRGIIHYMLPESVEQYYQEIGRAGRDKKTAWAKIFYSDKNIKVRKQQYIDKSFPHRKELIAAHRSIANEIVGLQSLNYFDSEEIQKNYHFFVETGLIESVAKGFRSLDIFRLNDNTLTEYNQIIAATTNKKIITTAKKTGLSIIQLMDKFYLWISNGKLKFDGKLPSKCLIINSKASSVDDPTLDLILEEIEKRKEHKHKLLDDFIEILAGFENSYKLHQEIGCYLGIDKDTLMRIFETRQGELVISKSEAIIANILFDEKINYKYEEKLFYSGKKYILPDFTLIINGKTYYWEHLGMIGNEEYDLKWNFKKQIYNINFKNQLITTREISALSKKVEEILQQLKSI